MKVLLVNPMTRNVTLSSPDLGLGYLSAALKRNGHEVSVLDCVNERLSLDQFGRRIAPLNFDVIGFKVFTTDILSVKKSVAVAKKCQPDSIFILGGAHPSVFPEQTMEYFQDAHYGFAGEAEEGLATLVNTLEKKQTETLVDIPGLIWRDGDRIRRNTPVLADNLDSLGSPDWNSIDPRIYPFQTFFFTKERVVAPLCMTRGCDYHCTFCTCRSVTGHKMRSHSPGYILNEIEFLSGNFGIKEFCFIDDNFLAFKNSIWHLCEELIRKKSKIHWSCFGVRLDLLDAETLKLMAAAGCFLFSTGIESGSQRILDHMNKRLTLEIVRKKLSLISSVTDIRVVGNFIIGYPEEKEEDIHKTIQFARSLPLAAANFYAFHPLPGTEIFQEFVSKKRIDADIDWDLSWSQDQIIYVPKEINSKKFLFLFVWAFFSFYGRPRIIFNLLRSGRSLGRLKYLFMRLASIVFQCCVGYKKCHKKCRDE